MILTLPKLSFFQVSFLEKLLFTKHLSMMLKSGIPLAEAITILKEQSRQSKFKKILEEILKDINNGQSLEKALANHRDLFDSLYLSLIGIGEKSGNLEKNLEHLTTQLEKKYEFNKKIQAALLYPELVLGATAVIGGLLSVFVLPKLVDLFNSLDVELPLTTKMVLFLATSMKNYGLIILGALAALGFLIFLLLNHPKILPKWQSFLLSLPFFGPLLQNIELASLCRNLGLMLGSGLTITKALATQEEATDNLIYKQYLSSLLKNVEKGQKLSEEITSNKFLYIPPIVGKMISVGENTGKLDEVLIYLGDFFEEEVDHTTKNLSNILEPILLLIIGVVVAFFALAIISPIYQLTGGIHR